jgi:hypothetical protein
MDGFAHDAVNGRLYSSFFWAMRDDWLGTSPCTVCAGLHAVEQSLKAAL